MQFYCGAYESILLNYALSGGFLGISLSWINRHPLSPPCWVSPPPPCLFLWTSKCLSIFFCGILAPVDNFRIFGGFLHLSGWIVWFSTGKSSVWWICVALIDPRSLSQSTLRLSGRIQLFAAFALLCMWFQLLANACTMHMFSVKCSYSLIKSYPEASLHGFPSHMWNYSLERHLQFLCFFHEWNTSNGYIYSCQSVYDSFFSLHVKHLTFFSSNHWKSIHGETKWSHLYPEQFDIVIFNSFAIQIVDTCSGT